MLRLIQLGEHLHRQGDIHAHRHRTPQRCVLKQHAEAAAPISVRRCLAAGPIVLAIDQECTLARTQQADHGFQHGALAAAAAAHHGEDAAAPHVKGQVALDHLRAERERYAAHASSGVLCRDPRGADRHALYADHVSQDREDQRPSR